MQKRLLFFNIFLFKGNNATDYPINRFLDELIDLNVEDRFSTINNTRYKLNAVRHDAANVNNREMWFCKYRNDKPFIGNRESDDTDPIDSDVIEPTVFNFISSSHLLVMGYNNYGPSYKNLAEYLNCFINNDGEEEQNKLEIRIIPVKTEDQILLIRNAQYINSIDIEYKVDDSDYSNLISGEYDDKAIFVEAMESNGKVSTLLGSKIGKLSLKKGRFKVPIDMQQALALFSSMDIEDETIRDVRVEVKDEFNKPKSISLKNNGILYKYIHVNGNTFDYLREIIRAEYYGNLNQPASSEHMRFVLNPLSYSNIIVND